METATATEIISLRETFLHKLGMAKGKFGFHFKMFHVTAYDIEHMNKADWDRYMHYVIRIMTETKDELKTPLTDSELLHGFSRSLVSISGPELRTSNAREVVDHCQEVLRDLSEYVTSEANRIS